jgi:uncharacterized membrane protein YfcA
MFWLVLAGFTGGILAGLLGIGGGIIYVLILPYSLEGAGIAPEHLAPFIIANSIFGVLFASLTTNYLNIRNNDFYLKEALWVGIPGAVFAVLVLKAVVTQSWFSVSYFYGVLIIFLAYMLLSLFFRKDQKKEAAIYKNKPLKLSLAGMAGGSLAASTGLGGGAAAVPILTNLLHMDIKKARSISLVMIFITALALTIFNLFEKPEVSPLTWQVGYIYFPAALPVTFGVMAGSPIGSKFGRTWSSKTIKILFGIFILAVLLEKSYHLFYGLIVSG